MNSFRKYLLAAALALLTGPAFAAAIPLFTGPAGSNPMDNPPTLGTMNQFINSVNSTPAQVPFGGPRNFLDNGSMLAKQRGTAAQTGGTTSGCSVTAYSADRWCVDTNVGSGAGKSQVATATPTPPLGFQNEVKVWRDSGSLTQPVCLIQEQETSRSVLIQGQTAIVSFFAQPLAGLTSASGNITLNVITGTGTDEGLGTMTASPAITPAWTGIASSATQTFALGTTAAWARYTSTPIAIPAAATEVGIQICFTPVGSSSGTTDGFAITGVQMEVAQNGQTAASPYEMRSVGDELARAQRFYYELDESATIFVAGACKAESVTVATCYVQFPQTMRSAPTMSYANGFATETTVAGGTLGACNTLATASTVSSTASGTLGILVGCTATTVPAAGSAGMLYSNGGSGKIKASADF